MMTITDSVNVEVKKTREGKKEAAALVDVLEKTKTED